jgi:hypothetical protein
MPTLVNLDLRNHYRSSSHLLGRDFLALALAHSSRYQRAAAFFSSSVFSVVRTEFAAFFASGRRAEVVCSPRLQPLDAVALAKAIYERPTLTSGARRSLDEVFASNDTSAILCELVVRGLLEMRIAVRARHSERALYHEKIGLFTDDTNSVLAFSGSTNESYSAWVDNFERVDVFTSWADRDERQRARAIELQFLQLWKNETPGVQVCSLVEAFRGQLIEPVASETAGRALEQPRPPSLPRSFPEALVPPSGLELFGHQRDAIREWGVAGGAGILHMATGSGKTFTALMLASKLYDRIGPGMTIGIVAPYIHSSTATQPHRLTRVSASWFDTFSMPSLEMPAVAPTSMDSRPSAQFSERGRTLLRSSMPSPTKLSLRAVQQKARIWQSSAWRAPRKRVVGGISSARRSSTRQFSNQSASLAD